MLFKENTVSRVESWNLPPIGQRMSMFVFTLHTEQKLKSEPFAQMWMHNWGEVGTHTTQTSTGLLSSLGIFLTDGSYSHKRTLRITWPGHLGIWKKKIMRELEQEAARTEQRNRRKRVCTVPNVGLLLWQTWSGQRKKYFHLGSIECSNRRTKRQLY